MISSAGEDGATSIPLKYRENNANDRATKKATWEFPVKLNIHVSEDPIISLQEK